MITKAEAFSRLIEHSDLAEIYEFAPMQLERVIDLALTCDDPLWKRADFALLSLVASHVAGKDADHSMLRTKRHEEALLAFIDWLLPEEVDAGMEIAS